MPWKPKIVGRFLRVARRRAHNAGMSVVEIQHALGYAAVQTIYNQEDDARGLDLEQLQNVANFYGLPMGVILCITRITSDYRDGKIEDARKIAKGLKAMADYVLVNEATLAKRDYKKAEIRERSNRKSEPYLFSPLAQTIIDFWDVYKKNGLYRPQWLDPGVQKAKGN